MELTSYISSNIVLKDVEENGEYDLYDANGKIGKINNNPIATEYISVIKDGAGVGRVRKMPSNSMIISTMGALIPKQSDINFIFSMLTHFSLDKQYTGSTIPHIYFKDYGNNLYYVSVLKEQERIGTLFNYIDILITLHQRKLTVLKQLRKAMITKFFINKP